MKINKRTGISWVSENLAVGPAPMSYHQLDELAEMGIGAILNLCAEFPDLPSIQREQGFDVFYLPVFDEEAPDLKDMDKALAWLDEAIYLGKKAYIHCRYGIGRTGTLLNAFMLRRGLGHKLASKELKRLRSKPESFDQWWSLRKYGRKSGKLTVRQPCLEFKNQVDLAPFFRDYEKMVSQAEDLIELSLKTKRCGCDHNFCCSTPVTLTLAEAVYLGTKVNVELCSDGRMALIERAAEVACREKEAKESIGKNDFCLTDSGMVCPLLTDRDCLLYAYRPLQCRTFELEASLKEEFWSEVLQPELDMLSRQIFFAYFSKFPEEKLPVFTLPDVVSGRYVQVFFHLIMDLGLCTC